MAGIDIRIVVIGLPSIARELGASVESIIWVTQAYALASTVALLLIGRITDLVGRVKIYNIGFAVFTVGSFFSSISFTAEELIAARVVQGVGAAMLISNSVAILTDATPEGELGTILGLNQIAFRVGSVVGLTLSGVILAVTSWRALFYINIPIGIFGTIWAHYRLKELSKPQGRQKMDWPGFFTFTSSITMILLSITFLSYGIGETWIGAGLFLAGLALLVVFVRVEKRTEAPILDLRLFKIREFMSGNLSQFLNALAWSGSIIMLSFYLQLVLGMSPLSAGLSLLPLEATYVVIGPISGRLSDKYGPRWFSTIGLAISSAAFFSLSLVSLKTSYIQIALPLALLGIGNGMFVSPNISSIMGSVPPDRRGIASSFRVTVFNVGQTASSGIATLLITFGLPYSIFSSLLEGTVPSDLSMTAMQGFVNGFRIAAVVLASLNTLAIVPSFLRGPRHHHGGQGGGGPLDPPKEDQAAPT